MFTRPKPPTPVEPPPAPLPLSPRRQCERGEWEQTWRRNEPCRRKAERLYPAYVLRPGEPPAFLATTLCAIHGGHEQRSRERACLQARETERRLYEETEREARTAAVQVVLAWARQELHLEPVSDVYAIAAAIERSTHS